MGTPVVVDFTNVKDSSGVNPTHQPAGDYHGKIIKATQGESQQNKTPMMTFFVQDVDRPSAVYAYRCTLTEKSLWKLRNILVAAGMTVPKKRIKVDPDKIVGKEIGMSLDDHEYEGKMSSEIMGVFPADDLPADDDEDTTDDADDSDDDDDDTPPPAAKKTSTKKAPAKKAKPAPVEEDEDEDLDELDIDDL